MTGPPDDPVIPLWVERLIAFAIVAVAGTLAALVGGWVMMAGSEVVLVGVILHPELAGLAAVGCGVMLGLAAIGRPGRALAAGRVATVAVVITAGVGGLTLAWAIEARQEFDAGAFRTAAARGDHEELEQQARLAVEDRVLIGRTRPQLSALLGAPDRTGPRRRLWIWDLGMIGDFLGPGDAGALYVQFDRRRERVVTAKVDLGF